jgi:hypothetical protein
MYVLHPQPREWHKAVFVGLFAELQKGTGSVFLSVHMEQLSSHWMDFNEI